jgi:hypothetical protein
MSAIPVQTKTKGGGNMVTFHDIDGVFKRPRMEYNVDGMSFTDTVPANARYVRHNEHGVLLYDADMNIVCRRRHQQYELAGKTRHYFDSIMNKADKALVESAPIETVVIRL